MNVRPVKLIYLLTLSSWSCWPILNPFLIAFDVTIRHAICTLIIYQNGYKILVGLSFLVGVWLADTLVCKILQIILLPFWQRHWTDKLHIAYLAVGLNRYDCVLEESLIRLSLNIVLILSNTLTKCCCGSPNTRWSWSLWWVWSAPVCLEKPHRRYQEFDHRLCSIGP